MSERSPAYVVNNVYHVDFGNEKFHMRPERMTYNNQLFPLAQVIAINRGSRPENTKRDD
jgi:hypothetical protein